ncbi:unnamed protein product, partial [Choristocarpus tenellus]
ADASGLTKHPEVQRVLLPCKEAIKLAEAMVTSGFHEKNPGCRPALKLMEAALAAAAEAKQARDAVAGEVEAALINKAERGRATGRLEAAGDVIAGLEGRLHRLSAATSRQERSLSGTRRRILNRTTTPDVASGGALGRVTAVDGNEEDAWQFVRGANKALATASEQVKSSWNVSTLEGVVEDAAGKSVAGAEAAVGEAEARGRLMDQGVAAVVRAATGAVRLSEEASLTGLAGRSSVVEALSSAGDTLRAALVASEGRGGDGVDAFVVTARASEAAVDRVRDAMAQERRAVEQAEGQRRECAKGLWAAARQLEGLDTASVASLDVEVAAMVLEARSEAVQALVVLEAAEDPSHHLARAEAALRQAEAAETEFVEVYRRKSRFDNARSLLKQAEAMVTDAVGNRGTDSRANTSGVTVERALEHYEETLEVAAASDGSTDAFLEACRTVLSAAENVERGAAQARQGALDWERWRRRELVRLEQPAVALAALNPMGVLEEEGDNSKGRVDAAVKDAMTALAEARGALVTAGGGEEEGNRESISAKVNQAVEAALKAERDYMEAREQRRRASRWQKKLRQLEAGLLRANETAMAHPRAALVSELCSPTLSNAAIAVEAAQKATRSTGRAWGVRVARLVSNARAKVEMAEQDLLEQADRVRKADARRATLRTALTTSLDSLAEAQATLEAEEATFYISAGVDVASGTNRLRVAAGTTMADALSACTRAAEAAVIAQGLLGKPLTVEWLEVSVASVGDPQVGQSPADEEERRVEEAQTRVAEAEEAVARLSERLAQVRGIRAKLRALLATSEAQFRRTSAVLADAGALHPPTAHAGEFRAFGGGPESVVKAVQVAGEALARARMRLQGPLGLGHLDVDARSKGEYGGLARDEESVSEAQGYVAALESFVDSVEHSILSPAGSTVHNTTLDLDEQTARDALDLAEQWGEALQAQVVELGLVGDHAVIKATESSAVAHRAAKASFSALSGSGEQCFWVEVRTAVEAFATELGRLEKAVEGATEQRRTREAGLGTAARRLERLKDSLGALRETVGTSDEALAILTAGAMDAAATATEAAVATLISGGSNGDDGGLRGLASKAATGLAALTDAVQTAAVSVAQAEATVTRAREQASQASAERVRALETLVGLAEGLGSAGDRLAASSSERGVEWSREATATMLEAQRSLSKARELAQGGVEAWVTGGSDIAAAVAVAGELVRRAGRTIDAPVQAPTDDRQQRVAGAVANAEAKAREWLEAEAEARASALADANQEEGKGGGGDGKSNQKAGTESTQKPRIGFSRGEGRVGAGKYLPLWMRMQMKTLGGGEEGGESSSNVVSDVTISPGSSKGEPPVAFTPTQKYESSSTLGQVEELDGALDCRKREERRLRAEADRLREEARQLRQARGDQQYGSGSSWDASTKLNSKVREGSSQAAEALAEDMVKKFAASAKADAIAGRSRLEGDTGSE